MINYNYCWSHSEWLGSRVTNAHKVAAFDFATLIDCSQLVRGPTHQGGGILDLILTDVPDLCQFSVGPSVNKPDYSALFFTLQLVEHALHFDLAFSVHQLSRVNWRGVHDALSSIRWDPFLRATQ